MATEIKETLLGDIRKLIHDAWEFFTPPLLKLGIAIAFFWYVCDVGPLVRLAEFARGQTAAFPATDVQGFLERYNLTALMPLAALFLVSVLAYSANRVISGVAALLPFKFTTSGEQMERLIIADPVLAQQWATRDAGHVRTLIEGALAKARYEKHESLLSSVEYWQKEGGRVHGMFSFAQFLVAWTVACAALSVTVEGAVPFTFAKVVLLLGGVLIFGVYSACKVAHTHEQLNYAKFHVARVVLADKEFAPPAVEPGLPLAAGAEISPIATRRARRRAVRKERWWYVGTGMMFEWWRMLKAYRYDDYPRYVRRPLLQALRDRGNNLIWFIASPLIIVILSRFSWWAGVILFVGYTSVTIIDCVLVTVTVTAVGWRVAAARLRGFLPQGILDEEEEPDESLRFDVGAAQVYSYATAAVRVAEAAVGILMSRVLVELLF